MLAQPLNAELISLDALNLERGLVSGDGAGVTEWTHRIAHARVTAIRAGRDAIVDDTSSPRFLRDDWRTLTRALGADFRLIYLQADPELVTGRRANNHIDPRRGATYGMRCWLAHLQAFEPPGRDEHPLVLNADSDSRALLRALLGHFPPTE